MKRSYMFIVIILVVIGTFLVLIPHILYLLAKITSLFCSWNITYKPFGLVALGLLILWVLTFFYGNKIGRFRSEVKEFAFTHKDIPEGFRGYRIVQISDIHLDGWTGHEKDLQRRVDEVNALNPDLICFTGDLVSISPTELMPFAEILKGLKAKDGVVSVLGNHDYMPYARESAEKKERNLEKVIDIERNVLGWKLLLNENITIHRRNDSIAIAGCENQSVGAHPVVQRGDIQKATKGIEGIFTILLTHDPSQWRKEIVGKTNIPLTLSGHTHAMQFRLFGFTPSKWIYRDCDGEYREDGQTLYVNIGLGGTMPMRIGATPEITLIELK